jgi:ATP-dependent Lon protease
MKSGGVSVIAGTGKILSGLREKFSPGHAAKSPDEDFPLLPLREMVLFPNTMVPVFLTYRAGIMAVEAGLRRDNRLFAACLRKGGAARESGSGETYAAGTVVRIIQHLRLPDNTFRVILQGEYRGTIRSTLSNDGVSVVAVEPLRLTGYSDPPNASLAALMRSVQKSFVQYAELSRKINTDTIAAVERAENPERLANLASNAMAVKAEKKIASLSCADMTKRLEFVLETLELENEIFGIQKNISGKVKSRMEKNQREYILHEQLREINKELGKEGAEDEFAELERIIEEKNPAGEVILKARKEIARLRKLQPFSPEAGVLRGYLEWISDLPWSERSADSGDLAEAERILDRDHFGMKKPKERILEFIAVRQLAAGTYRVPGAAGAEAGRTPDAGPEETETGTAGDGFPPEAGPHGDPGAPEAASGPGYDGPADPSGGIPAGLSAEPAGEADTAKTGAAEPAGTAVRGPILCFVGPPGTGKTSLGRSVARALGRRFVRISLGGVRDEAEIRGHRKTYVGALPGKIIQSMRKAGTMNPVFLLDEIDKLSSDFRGDPANALLEVLDPEQNSGFTDHYMELAYDLSGVLFITTANSLHTIPYPLLDRMEIIEVPGYGENEKLAIAKQFLVPKELGENGLGEAKIGFRDDALLEIIRHWTMESGVRSLEREIARCARRIARSAVKKGYGREPDRPVAGFRKIVRREDLEKLLGRRKYKNDVVFKEARIGVCYGLAWTEYGGTMLPVETVAFPGNGELIITGNLGEVMKESARIALSYLRSVQDRHRFLIRDAGRTNFHIHVPEGAIPKDGPSAGVTLAASLLSTLCRKPPRPGIAMTGELTLTGRILPIGGLKEKLLAAVRNGMDRVLLPAGNRDDWLELDRDIRDAIAADFMESADDAFTILFDGERPKEPGKKRKSNPKPARPAAPVEKRKPRGS